MIETILTKIGALILTPVVFLSTFFVQPQQAPVVEDEALGVALPSGTALFETSLASPITGSASSLTLVANSIRGGGSLSGYQCFTIDEGSAQAEYVCGTVSGTSVTSLERGLSPSDGITQTASLQFSHRRGSSVKITDFPLIQRLKSQASGTGTYENVLTYAAGVTPTNSGDLADREYVLSVITGTSSISYDKHVIQGTAGETMATGSIVYLRASDSRWYKADNDLPETYVDQTLGIAQGPGTSGSSISGGVLTYGLDSTQRSLTPGGFVFLSATAGATSTATTSQVLGKSISATTMFFDQNLLDSYSNASATIAGATTFTNQVTFNATTTGTLGSTTLRIYTASTTWTKPQFVKQIDIIVCGAGGDGGAGSASSDSGGGGGAGSCGFMSLSASDLVGTSTIEVGVSAGPGGTSKFGTFCSAPSGTNGSGTSAGSGGGNVTGCDYGIPGANGSGGLNLGTGDVGGSVGGSTAVSPGGGGGNLTTGSGQSGFYGSGGGGGAGSAGSGSGSGGGGGDGVIFVKEIF